MSDNIYIVYETTNLINGKYYIGVHKIDGRNYLGSGTILNNAILKYGRDNFIRETLHEFDNKQDALDFEELIVDDEMISNDNCYNITLGGGYPPTIYGERPKEWKNNISDSLKGKKKSKEHCDSLRNNHADFSGSNHPKWGTHCSDETRLKISLSNIGKKGLCGVDNPSYGKIGKLSPRSKKWFIHGRLFYSSKSAGDFFGVNGMTISNWCKKYKIPHCYVV